ncbi:DNA polymerase III subunit beta, partial [Streptococcus agalactiae]|nr:DNA polymerase III subunit beta [Streptococcus agalactiae]
FRSENISFYTRLLEGNYPDTDRLLTNQFETEIIFNTNALRHAMERAYLISNATQNGTVRLEIQNETVSAHVNSPEVGKVNEELDTVSLKGDSLNISFNPTYLIESLKAVKSETVTIRFISPVRPFTLTPGEDTEDFI